MPYQVLEKKQMLYEFLTRPDDVVKHIHRYTNALTTTTVFSWRTPTYEDEKMKQLFEGFSDFADLKQTGAAGLVDFFPWLQRLPDAVLPVQRKAKQLHRAEKELYPSHWLNAKEATLKGTIKPCFCWTLLERRRKGGLRTMQRATYRAHCSRLGPTPRPAR